MMIGTQNCEIGEAMAEVLVLVLISLRNDVVLLQILRFWTIFHFALADDFGEFSGVVTFFHDGLAIEVFMMYIGTYHFGT